MNARIGPNGPIGDPAPTLADSAAEPTDLERLGAEAQALTRRGLDAVREGSQQLRERAEHASDATLDYIRDRPVKSVLIAAASGALLMALVTLFSRSARARA